jgi:hypothetical protein
MPTATALPAAVETVSRPRRVERLVVGQPTSDGAGVKLDRVLTQALQQRLDPFLMLDAFRSDDPDDYLAGFPDHPHRGFETVTYMIAGRMRHKDSAGNEGLLEGGGVQWMTAGRGVIHSELPEQRDGLMEGFQLWLNLPAADKMREPWYRDFRAADLPAFVTAIGKALLTRLDSQQLLALLPERLVHRPLSVSMTRAALLRELAESRERGWTELVDSAERGIGAAAVAIGAPQGRTIGIALSWMQRDMTRPRHRRAVAELLSAARTVGRRVRDPYWLPPEER